MSPEWLLETRRQGGKLEVTLGARSSAVALAPFCRRECPNLDGSCRSGSQSLPRPNPPVSHSRKCLRTFPQTQSISLSSVPQSRKFTLT